MIVLAVGTLCAAAAVAAVLARLRAPLLGVLTELCLGEERARFWWRVVTIEVGAGTALTTSLAMLLLSRTQSWRWVAVMVQGSLVGLLVSLGAVMAGVLAFQRERDRVPSPTDG